VLILVASEEMRQVKKDAPRALIASLSLGCISGVLVSAAVLRVLNPATIQSLPLADLAARLGGAIAQAWLLTIGVVILAAFGPNSRLIKPRHPRTGPSGDRRGACCPGASRVSPLPKLLEWSTISSCYLRIHKA
jgi:hypothetical protein